MKFLSPEIAKLAKSQSKNSLAKLGTSCGIFQDCFDKNQSVDNYQLKRLEDEK
jgi:hypothetical protein